VKHSANPWTIDNGRDAFGQKLARVLPVQWGHASLRKVIASTHRNHSNRSANTGAHYPVDRFVNAAASTGNDNADCASINALQDLCLKTFD
jgi:hypothetical protein